MSDSDSSQAELAKDWPAPAAQLSAARAFIRECAASSAPTLLLPDKDTDGLCSGLITYLTLTHLGLPPSLISVHFPAKGSNIHAAPERERIAAYSARYVIATDQGSRGGPPLVDDPATKTLIMDHHWSTEFPEGAVVCLAAQCPPVATASTLAYVVCTGMLGGGEKDRKVKQRLDWLCAMGTMGDLGTSFKWEAPFPDMRECFKRWTKKTLGEAIALLNAPYDVETAWRALLKSTSPKEIVNPESSKDVRRLFVARAEVKSETDRCARKPPTCSGDGRIALIRISSEAQIHPLIATRWSSSLKGPRLEVVMCANDGYNAGMTNFACRVAKSRKAAAGEGATDIIAILKEYASRIPGLREAMGDDFARGHKEASGGIVLTEHFERLWEVMANAEREEGGPPAKKRKTGKEGPAQKNTLEGWLRKA
ncbi:DHH phosphoesterase [Lentinus brumalis]|uniref:DHH phosphoesterase n=1 Tax=Lentinus brumalis TaxID=2498619 RepID=A0A371CX02_9APHY|nr:DHH phosphoesterase [Polyporus brumalis]